MSFWIFKIIWMPILAILFLCASAVLIFIFKEVGWEQPYRWLVIVFAVSYAADVAINGW